MALPTDASADLVAAVDVGSSVVKAAVFDRTGGVHGMTRARTSPLSPEPGAAELDPSELLQKPLSTLGQAIAGSDIDPGRIVAVAVTGARGSILARDTSAHPIGPVIMWTDNRGQPYLDILVDTLGGSAQVTETLGVAPGTFLSVAAILRLKDHIPDLDSRIGSFGGPQALLIEALTGDFATDASHAVYYGLTGLGGRSWDPVLCSCAGIAAHSLPRIVPVGTRAGTLTQDMAARLGLCAAIPVIAAGSDAACYKLGAGLTGPGQATISIGTAASIGMLVAKPQIDVTGHLACTPATLEGLWEIGAIQPSGGAMLDWFIATVFHNEPPAIDRLIAEADAIAPGADGVIAVPYLMGSGQPGAGGTSALFAGIRRRHRRAHLARAVLEGVAFSLREILEIMQNRGHDAGLFRMVGAAARSEPWVQIVTNALNLPIDTVSAEEPALTGAAIAASTEIGLHRNLTEAIGAMTSVKRRFYPSPLATAVYDRIYPQFRRFSANAHVGSGNE